MVVLVFMVMLLVLALGLLQLSSITLRSSEQQKWTTEARANARLALMMGLAQLQKEMGPDQRVSAPAGVLDADPETPAVEGVANPRFNGVWQAADEVSVANMDAKPKGQKEAFRAWLVSAPDSADFSYAAKTSLEADASARIAVGSGSVSDPADQVRVPVIRSDRGGFAWWTSDNGQKATLRASDSPRSAPSQDIASTLAESRRFNPLGHHVMDGVMPESEEKLAKLPDAAMIDVAGSAPAPAGGDLPSHRYFHDLTTQSEFIPVDVTAGKLKRCMNLWLASLEEQGQGAAANAGTLGQNGGIDRDYRLFSWDQLRNAMGYTNNSAMLAFDSRGRPRVTAYRQAGFGGGRDDMETNPSIERDRWRIQPVLLKTAYVVSYSAIQMTAPPDTNKPLALRLHIYPIVVLWNPYNVDLVVPEYNAGSSPIPVVFNINAAGQSTVVDFVKRNATIYPAFGPESPQKSASNLVIPAGATRVLYPEKFDPSHPEYHRNRFPYDYYFWMQNKSFDCGPGNYGGPFLNLKDDRNTSFQSNPGSEIAGGAGDSVRISVAPSVTNLSSNTGGISLQMGGEHTDWHGNNGSGSDDLNTLERFGTSTLTGFRFTPTSPQISVIPDGQIPALTFGQLLNRPTPLFIFETYRKPLDENLFPSKDWSFSMPSHAIHASPSSLATDQVTPWFEDGFTFRFNAVTSWIDVSKRMQLPPNRDDEAYFGTSYSPSGQLRAIAQEIPLVPPSSLAQLQHLPLFDYRPEPKVPENPFGMGIDFKFHRGRITQFPQNNAIGNSFASPGIPALAITSKGWPYWAYDISHPAPVRFDRSYIANKLLWDGWWCSSLFPQDGPFFHKYGQPRKLQEVASQWLQGKRSLPDEASQVRTTQAPEAVISSLFGAGGKLNPDAAARLATFVRINGGFNVNSVSAKAWEQFYSQMLSRAVVTMNSTEGTEKPEITPAREDAFTVSRFTFQGGLAAERANGRDREDSWWNGCRELTPDQIRGLAEATVRQVKRRGPFRSLADFVNRSLAGDPDLALKGALQSALDDSRSNVNQPLADLSVSYGPGVPRPQYQFPAAAEGPLRQGIPGWVTQADLLQVVGPALAPRSDTFTIRAMGESVDAKGEPRARAWCEAVVQRGVAYVSPADPPERAAKDLSDPSNKIFGRRMELVSFRWLSADETREIKKS